ncbi:MAG TPA: acylphosphatase [Candidatus Brocadiia bacterium]|nr:acylphosphatase [Planctomycetota bacterium]MDO8094483.1 acylphosphatase [Candidatus Brocadiales bacterium]
MSIVRAHVYVEGMVQGVFFRAGTVDKARSLNIVGWVRNCQDGSVEAVFEGKKDVVEKIVNWCRVGPSGAIVRNVDVNWEEPTGEFKTFSIKY